MATDDLTKLLPIAVDFNMKKKKNSRVIWLHKQNEIIIKASIL